MIRIFYIAGLLVVFGLKYYHSNAGVDDLKWILTPTAWWVRFMSGISFEYEPNVGYINHHFKFIIAKSCSGVQFMIITIAALIFTFTHRMEPVKKGFYWFVISIGASYIFTIFVNSVRIIVSIYFKNKNIYVGWLTPERLHTVIGIAIYFASFIFIYNIAARMQKQFLRFSYISPAIWYFAIALVIPFINKAYKNSGGKFMEYAVLMIAVCTAIISILCICRRLWFSVHTRKKN